MVLWTVLDFIHHKSTHQLDFGGIGREEDCLQGPVDLVGLHVETDKGQAPAAATAAAAAAEAAVAAGPHSSNLCWTLSYSFLS